MSTLILQQKNNLFWDFNDFYVFRKYLILWTVY